MSDDENIEEEARIAEERENDHPEFLSGKIRELVDLSNDIVCVERSATVAEAAKAMVASRVGVVVVVNEDKLEGLFSERDLVTRVVAIGRSPEETRIEDVMTSSPECLTSEDEIIFALNRMTVGGFRHIPILDQNGKPQTMLSMRDVVQHIISYYSDEVFNLPWNPSDSVTMQREGA